MADRYDILVCLILGLVVLAVFVLGVNCGHNVIPPKVDGNTIWKEHRVCNRRGMFLARREGNVVLCYRPGSWGRFVPVPVNSQRREED